MFAAQQCARSVNVHLALSTTQKGATSITEYFTKMRSLSDEMAITGKPLDDEELTAYILNDLDIDYKAIIYVVLTRENPISLTELYSQLLNFESRAKLKGASGYLANVTHHGGRGVPRGHTSGRGHASRGRGTSHGHGNTSLRPYVSRQHQQHIQMHLDDDDRPLCQVCFKKGHTTGKCWHRFDENYVLDPKLVAATTSTSSSHVYNIDTNWYIDTGATDHITSELEKLTL
jgi:hypothetical protein